MSHHTAEEYREAKFLAMRLYCMIYRHEWDVEEATKRYLTGPHHRHLIDRMVDDILSTMGKDED